MHQKISLCQRLSSPSDQNPASLSFTHKLGGNNFNWKLGASGCMERLHLFTAMCRRGRIRGRGKSAKNSRRAQAQQRRHLRSFVLTAAGCGRHVKEEDAWGKKNGKSIEYICHRELTGARSSPGASRLDRRVCRCRCGWTIAPGRQQGTPSVLTSLVVFFI